MHTFFINTTANRFTQTVDLLDIQREVRKYAAFDCRLSAWYDPDQGYEHCALQISEMINSYKDVKNEYNLIICADLLELKKYAQSLVGTVPNQTEAAAVYDLARKLIVHFLSSTICMKLDDLGCQPNETLILFEQNGDFAAKGDGVMLRNLQLEKLLAMLGLPGKETLKQLTAEHQTEDGLKAAIRSAKQTPVIAGVEWVYSEQITALLDTLRDGTSVDRACEALLQSVEKIHEHEMRAVAVSQWVTDRRALYENVQMNVKRSLQLQIFLLECTVTETTLKNPAQIAAGKAAEAKTVPDPGKNWDALTAALKAKYAVYKKRYQEATELEGHASSLKLLPDLYALDYGRFGMDEYGTGAYDLTLVDASEPEDKESEAQPQKAIVSKKRKALEVTEKKTGSLFPKDEFELFDYDGLDRGDEKVSATGTTEYYVEKARKVRWHHLDYLKKLKAHVSDTLSNYAGRSLENRPAVLSARRVSVGEESSVDYSRSYRYARPDKKTEDRSLDTAREIAANAYETALMEYLRFCAGRSVAVTDIEEQCNWFVTRIHQIKESLGKIKTVALGTVLGVLALYAPYLIIQWTTVTENAVSALIALGCVAVPLVVLAAVLTVLTILQRRMCLKAWEEFKDKSTQALEENNLAAEKYDQLLSAFVPALRWVYEYKLDVDFYEECCKMAKVKIGHHVGKLRERVVTIGNILEDLGCRDDEKGISQADRTEILHDEIDYHVSFCTGDQNRQFYSIVDDRLLETMKD